MIIDIQLPWSKDDANRCSSISNDTHRSGMTRPDVLYSDTVATFAYDFFKVVSLHFIESGYLAAL
jgi:hypothetical protein